MTPFLKLEFKCLKSNAQFHQLENTNKMTYMKGFFERFGGGRFEGYRNDMKNNKERKGGHKIGKMDRRCLWMAP